MYPGQYSSSRPQGGQSQPNHQQQQYGAPPPGQYGYQQQPQYNGPPGPYQQQPPQHQYAPPSGPPPSYNNGPQGQPYQQQQYNQQQGQYGQRQQSNSGYIPPAAVIPAFPPPHQPPPHNQGPYEPVPHHPPPTPPPGWPQGQQWQQPQGQYLQETAPYLSNCSGNKKALLVGVNYKGTKSELRGCINDVQNIKNFLTTKFGFPDTPQNMIVLTDDNPNMHFRPLRQNILQAMQWLVAGAKAGDSLFFHFSGHGSQQTDKDGDESDGTDETICPEDYQTAGQITDDMMNSIMVRPLAAGVRLTALFDCCHSGSSLDLPFTYLPNGTLKEKTAAKRLGGAAMDVAKGFSKGGILGAGMSLFKAANSITNQGASKDQLVATKGNLFADVVMLSGCKDKQTSADAHIEGSHTGAMTYGFTKALSMYHSPSYGQLLGEIRNLLQGKYSQRPQLSSGRMMDMNQIFIM
ncbi:caspase domain-containing protein [Powellomyces hirtus]|nr:caspase domain-containing protein [Powellomyces hirtus]